jgi:hypothetical protein
VKAASTGRFGRRFGTVINVLAYLLNLGHYYWVMFTTVKAPVTDSKPSKLVDSMTGLARAALDNGVSYEDVEAYLKGRASNKLPKF